MRYRSVWAVALVTMFLAGFWIGRIPRRPSEEKPVASLELGPTILVENHNTRSSAKIVEVPTSLQSKTRIPEQKQYLTVISKGFAVPGIQEITPEQRQVNFKREVL
jgi:hypothetical protein